MPLFTMRDRIAIAVLARGHPRRWGVRLWQFRAVPDDGVRIVRVRWLRPPRRRIP
jgi:hypothetical protein